jgi:hypothetical protein
MMHCGHPGCKKPDCWNGEEDVYLHMLTPDPGGPGGPAGEALSRLTHHAFRNYSSDCHNPAHAKGCKWIRINRASRTVKPAKKSATGD